MHHNGIRETLIAIRQNYWILKGRKLVKNVIRQCLVCNRYEGKSYTAPLIPDLPAERVSSKPPFCNTGVDFAGPLYVRKRQSTDHTYKVYICLFTCASTRALHLELVKDLSASTFLQAFRRFCSRRGVPTTVVSDNAKTIQASAREIKDVICSETVRQYLTNRCIDWQFIIEKGPWWEGFWERLIKDVKRSLKKIIGRASLTVEKMSTLIVEIEGTLKNRPLTYVYDDAEGIDQPLTPANLIYGRKVAISPSDLTY